MARRNEQEWQELKEKAREMLKAEGRLRPSVVQRALNLNYPKAKDLIQEILSEQLTPLAEKSLSPTPPPTPQETVNSNTEVVVEQKSKTISMEEFRKQLHEMIALIPDDQRKRFADELSEAASGQYVIARRRSSGYFPYGA